MQSINRPLWAWDRAGGKQGAISNIVSDTVKIVFKRRLVDRVLRLWTEMARGGRFPRRDQIEPSTLGADWANCLVIAVQSPAPMLHAMNFDEIVANDMVILGGPKTVANTILRLSSQLDLMGLALIFKLGAMPYDMVEYSMRTFGEKVVPRVSHVLDRDAAANSAGAA